MSVLLPTAADRLVLSRERLRQALREISAPAAGSKNAGPEAWVWAWFSNLKAKPGASGLVEAMRKLWTQHPLRVAGELGIDVAKTVLKPFAQRHPISLVLGAFALGGLLAWTRPWRPLLTPALLVGLLPQILSKAASRMTTESWLAVLASLARLQPGSGAASGTARPDQPICSKSKD